MGSTVGYGDINPANNSERGFSRGRALPHRHQGDLYPRRQRGPHHPVRARHHRASVTCRLCCSICLRKVISTSTIISDNSLPKTCHHKIKVFPVFYSFSAKKELDNSDRKLKLGLGQKNYTSDVKF